MSAHHAALTPPASFINALNPVRGCWNETQPRRQACPGVTPASRRRNLSLEATWRSMALGRWFDICNAALPGRTQHVAYALVGSVSASSR